MKKVLIVMLVVLGAIPALANTKSVTDPQGDVENPDAGDVRSVTAGHTKTGKLKHTIVLYNRVTSDTRPHLDITLSTAPEANCDQGYEHLYEIGDPNGKIYNLCKATFFGSYITKRPNPKTIVYIFSKGTITRPTKYFWGVRTLQEGDTAPDESSFYMFGWGQYGVKHRL